MRARRAIVIGAIVGMVAAVSLFWARDIPEEALKARYFGPHDRMVQIERHFALRVRDQGDRSKPTLLLLHGSGDSLEAWDRAAPLLRGDFRLLAVDLPGHGLTGPDPRRDYSPERLAVVLDNVLAEAGVPRATIVGNSMGGWVAWNYAAMRPKRVAGLVLVDAYGAPNQAPVELPFAFTLARWPIVRHALRGITPRSAVGDGLRSSSFDPGWIDDRQIDRHWLLLRREGNRQAMLDQFQILQPSARPSDVAGIRAPTLIIWGRQDRLIPYQNGLWFARHMKNSRTVLLDDVGHLPMQEDPKRFSRVLRSWHSLTLGTESKLPNLH